MAGFPLYVAVLFATWLVAGLAVHRLVSWLYATRVRGLIHASGAAESDVVLHGDLTRPSGRSPSVGWVRRRRWLREGVYLLAGLAQGLTASGIVLLFIHPEYFSLPGLLLLAGMVMVPALLLQAGMLLWRRFPIGSAGLGGMSTLVGLFVAACAVVSTMVVVEERGLHLAGHALNAACCGCGSFLRDDQRMYLLRSSFSRTGFRVARTIASSITS